MKSLLKLSIFMFIFSMITLGSTVAEAIIYLILSGVIYLLASYCKSLVDIIKQVHEYTISHTEKHKHLESEMERIEENVEQISTDLKTQIQSINRKLDDFILEIRRDRKNTEK